MAFKMDPYVSCIKINGVPMIPPLMTEDKRQEIKEYKEKAMIYEHKLKEKNMQKPTYALKEPACDVKISNKISSLNSQQTDTSVFQEIPTSQSVEEDFKLNNCFSYRETKNVKSENTSSLEQFCGNSLTKQEPFSNLSINDGYNFNDSSPDKESISIKCSNSIKSVINETIYDIDNIKADQIPRLRSNSYTLSSPSSKLVAFLNSRVQQQLNEPKSLEKNIINNCNIESKSEPSNINVIDGHQILKTKSISMNSVSGSLHTQGIIDNIVKYKEVSNTHLKNKILLDENQDEKESVKTIVINSSNDESLVGSVSNVYNGNSDDNQTIVSSITSESLKHCCCRYSDNEYSFSNNNIHYKTRGELNLEAERLRIEKLDMEKRHEEELSNLMKKQREELEQIAVEYYLITQSTSSMSIDDSEYSESLFKKNHSSLNQSETITVNNKSIISGTSSIISNCSINKNLVCSSPRQSTPTRSPYLKQNIKFYHKIRGGLSSKRIEIENAAATIINAVVRGYLTRRLLHTEKAQLIKRTILDSLKTALEMHKEFKKKQQPTESDLGLHRRIINQLTTACYDLNDLILGSVHERMAIIRADRQRIIAVKMRRKSSSALSNNPNPSIKLPKKSTSKHSLSKKTSSNFEKSFYKRL